MRHWINLMEAGIVNADKPITVRYHAENGSIASYTMPDLKTVIHNSLYELPGPVLEWFTTVFANWVKRESPEATIDLVFQTSTRDWIADWLSDMTWGNIDPAVHPSTERYGTNILD